MPAGVAILAIENLQDGAHARVTLSGTPNGEVAFFAARTPERSAAAPVVFAGDNPYTLAFPAPVGWHVWVEDGGELAPEPAAVWIGLSDNKTLNEVGEAVAGILRANIRLLDAAIAQGAHRPTVQQVVYGYGGVVEAYPSLLLLRPRLERVAIAMPWVFQETYRLTLFTLLAHHEEQTEIETNARLAGAAMAILNTPDYETIVLPSGVVVTTCHCREAEVNEREVIPDVFEVQGVASWSGEATRQDAP